MTRKAKKNSPVGTGTILGIGAGLAAAAGLIYAATRPSSSTPPATMTGPGQPSPTQYGTGNGNLTMEQRFDQGAAEYMRTHPNI